jgi:hypothetical protein
MYGHTRATIDCESGRLIHRPGQAVRGICGSLSSVAVTNARFGCRRLPAAEPAWCIQQLITSILIDLFAPLVVAPRLPANRFRQSTGVASRPESLLFRLRGVRSIHNTIKNAKVSRLEVAVEDSGAVLNVCIRDNGVGGANPRGSGLIGLPDGVEAIGGSMQIISPADGGTLIGIFAADPTD